MSLLLDSIQSKHPGKPLYNASAPFYALSPDLSSVIILTKYTEKELQHIHSLLINHQASLLSNSSREIKALVEKVNFLSHKAFHSSLNHTESYENILFSSRVQTPYKAFSNFFPSLIYCPFLPQFLKNQNYPQEIVDIFDRCFPNIECAYQLTKLAMHGVDASTLRNLLENCSEPLHLKERCQSLLGEETSPDWEKSKLSLMEKLVSLKFKQDFFLRSLLIKTGNACLQEKTSSSYWGIGRDGDGENHLGQILMNLRQKLLIEDSGV